MKIGLISLISPVHDREEIDRSLNGYLSGLKERFKVEEFSPEEMAERDGYDLILVFVKTGGTENQFCDIYQNLPQPIYLLSTPFHNSLPAAIEILSWIRVRQGRGRIIHGDHRRVFKKLREVIRMQDVEKKIQKSRIGVIGRPSDWLIASNVDENAVSENWGTEIKNINIEEIYNLYKDYSSEDVREISKGIIKNAETMVENSEEDVYNAIKIYLALKHLVKKYQLTALTMRCFELVKDLQTTGCMALSLLNDRGVVAGCEGDIPATFTMLLSNHLTGKDSFMSNPATIDNDIILFAHCTVPASIVSNYKLRSHFETGLGVAIQGEFRPGPVTLLKIGGTGLDKCFVTEGEILRNQASNFACRTQILVKANNENTQEYFLNDPLGNHHIIIPGHHGKIIRKFLETRNITFYGG